MDLPEVTGLDHHTFMALGPGARAAPYGLPSPLGPSTAPVCTEEGLERSAGEMRSESASFFLLRMP